MTQQILDGKKVAGEITEVTGKKVSELKAKGIQPTLAIVRIGENPSDLSYERGAIKRAEKTGIATRQCVYEQDISQDDLLAEIRKLNEDDQVHGILIFRPLPKHIDDEAVCQTLLPAKDIDGITNGSLAGIFTGSHEGFAPCTARACMEILKFYGISLEGKRVAVLGRSLVIGKPVAMMAMEAQGTVTVCHSRTGEAQMKEICKNSHVIIAAMGKAAMVTGEYIKEGQIVLDVGINVNDEGKLCGDVDFSSAGAAEFITPVPGGVGAVTTAVLMQQTVEAAVRMGR